MSGRLVLAPLLYHWPTDQWRDFYLRIADEAPVDCVHLGEIVCPKRAPFTLPHLPEVAERLRAAGKEVVLSTPALVVDERDVALAVDAIAATDGLVEANDVATLVLLAGRAHVIGPYVNVYNESTLRRVAGAGAVRVALPVELGAAAVGALADCGAAEIEAHVFGRWPLAISARCYHARAYGRTKDACQFACGEDPGGLPVDTLDGEPFLAVNGVQVLSRTIGCLAGELGALAAMGVAGFRLSPERVDMVAVASAYRAVLDSRIEGAEGRARVAALLGDRPLSNGFHHGMEGARLRV